jgi:putative flippase GtrA
MNTQTLPRRLLAETVAVVAGLAVVALLLELVGARLFTQTFHEGPLSISIAFPGSLVVGIAVAMSVRRLVRDQHPTVPTAAIALALGGVAYMAVGGATGVYASVSASPFRDLFITVALAFVAGIVVAVAVSRHLTARDDRPAARRSLLAVLAGVLVGVGGGLAILLGLTALLDPYIWPSVFVSGPVGIVAGFVLAVVVYRYVSNRGDATAEH